MSIITISRGSYTHGKAVADKVAAKLEYRCVSREIALEASKEFNIPEIKLIRTMGDPPSVFDRLTYGREKYIAYIEATILKNLQKDNVVYHGLAGHFFVRGVPHVLRVRINASIEDRAEILMKRDKISKSKAMKMVRRIDRARRHWSKQLYGIDSWDSSLYDLVINVARIPIDDAVKRICRTASLKSFQTTPESKRAMADLVLAAKVKAALLALKPDIEVFAQDGVVVVRTTAPESKEVEFTREMKKTVASFPGLKEIRVDFMPVTLF
jgi:cytidylate kinase